MSPTFASRFGAIDEAVAVAVVASHRSVSKVEIILRVGILDLGQTEFGNQRLIRIGPKWFDRAFPLRTYRAFGGAVLLSVIATRRFLQVLDVVVAIDRHPTGTRDSLEIGAGKRRDFFWLDFAVTVPIQSLQGFTQTGLTKYALRPRARKPLRASAKRAKDGSKSESASSLFIPSPKWIRR